MANGAVVIISSSPAPSPAQNTIARAPPRGRTRLSQNFESFIDNIDALESLEFPVEQPSKRRRLNSNADDNRSTNAYTLGPKVHNIDCDPFSSSQDDALLPIWPSKQSEDIVDQLASHDLLTQTNAHAGGLSSTIHRGERMKENVPILELSSDDSNQDFMDNDCLGFSQLDENRTVEKGYSTRTASLLANLSADGEEPKVFKAQRTKTTALEPSIPSKCPSGTKDDIVFTSSPVRTQSIARSKATDGARNGKAADRAVAKETQKLEREAEKERKRVEKEKTVLEKRKQAALAEANKSKLNKRVAAPEMIMDISARLKDSSLGEQVEARMKAFDIALHWVDQNIAPSDSEGERERVGNIITWRRKVGTTYNGDDDQWVPTSRVRVQTESHVLVHISAVEFAAMAEPSKQISAAADGPSPDTMKTNINAHIESLRQRYPDCTIIYLIEGLYAWLKKNQNAKNREYSAAVRAQMSGGMDQPTETASSQTRPRKSKKATDASNNLSFMTLDVVEDLLLHLQLFHQPILVHHSTSASTSAAQISAFTEHLSTRPYRLRALEHNLKSASFCMEAGQVRTGDDAKDTFVKMLQEVQRVTPSMAYGIVDHFPSVRQLLQGFEKEGNLLLEHVKKSTNKDGGWSDRKLGPMVSRRLHKLFMGRDPLSTDGIT